MEPMIGVYYAISAPIQDMEFIQQALSTSKFSKLANDKDIRVKHGVHIVTTTNSDLDPDMYMIFVDEMTFESEFGTLPKFTIDPVKMIEVFEAYKDGVTYLTDIHEYLVSKYKEAKKNAKLLNIGWTCALCQFDGDSDSSSDD